MRKSSATDADDISFVSKLIETILDVKSSTKVVSFDPVDWHENSLKSAVKINSKEKKEDQSRLHVLEAFERMRLYRSAGNGRLYIEHLGDESMSRFGTYSKV